MNKNFRLGLPFWALALLIWLASGWPWLSPTNAAAPTPEDHVRQAWQLARESGGYHYRSRVDQTVYPAPAVVNAGRIPDQTHLGVEGQVDLSAETLDFTLWQDASFDPQRGISIRVEDEKTFARQGIQGWQEIDNVGDSFAPGGDPLGFLAGARNIQLAGQEQVTVGNLDLTYVKYTFDLNGPAFAEHSRDQIEDLHRKKYGLPPGMNLNTADAYLRMTGSGQLWLNENGLPARMQIELEMPDQPKKGEHLQASIANDYFDYNLAALQPASPTAWENPARWVQVTWQHGLTALGQQIPQLQVLLALALLSALCLHFWRTPHFHRSLVITVIVSMVCSPLLQSVQARSYVERVTSARQDQEARQADSQDRQEVLERYQQSRAWNPNQAPGPAALTAPNAEAALTSAGPVLQTAAVAPVQDSLTRSQSAAPQAASTTSDSDSDGLSDDDESYWGTCAYVKGSSAYLGSADCDAVNDPADSDADGLTDYAEIYQLNTYPTSDDTDGDSISDSLEIKGFSYAGQTWYLNPIEEDTNSDGLVDSGECDIFTATPITSLSATICPDDDNDGTPNFADDDNDGDAVPDEVDLSPNARNTQIFADDNPLTLSISDLTSGEPVLVDIQLTPTRSDHLTYYNHVLDWPFDDDGQIQRRLNTTWADTANADARASDASAANGDIRLVPMLEIIMPYTEGHYANLPVKSGASTTRTLGDPVANWLDESVTEPYSMQIDDMDLDAGELVAYVPLIINSDDTGAPKAFSTRFIYQPSQNTWGAAHEFRVVWLVQMLTDECIDSSADEDTCARQDTVTIIHRYDDTWQLTGLNVSEERGFNVAILHENPEQDTDLSFDDQLWYASWNLGNTFLRGRDCDSYDGDGDCIGNGERDVRVDNLESQVDSWNLNFTNVNTFSYPHQGYIAEIMMTETVAILDTYFASYANQTVPTILIAQETETRANNLDSYTGSQNANLSIPMHMDDAPLQTTAQLSWASYQYTDGSWQNYNAEEYIEYLADTLAGQTFFQTVDDSQSNLDEAEGKLLWAQMYYAALYNGALSMVEADGTVIWEPSVSFPEIEMDPMMPTNSNWGASTIAYEFAIVYASNKFSPQLQSGIWKTITSYANGVTEDSPLFIRMNKGGFGGNVIAVAAIAVMAVAIPILILGMMTGNEQVTRVGVILMSLVSIVVSTYYLVMALQKIITTLQTVAGFAAKVGSALSAGKAFQGMGAIGLVIGLTLTWGMVGYMLGTGKIRGAAAGYAIAMAIAATIVLIMYFILDVIGLGFIVLILVLIDALMALFGKKGPTQLLTEAIADTLYDVRMLITNLDDSTRLKLSLDNIALLNDDGGFTVSNSVVYTVSVTNTLQHRSYSYDGDTINFEDLDNRTVFRYYSQADEIDQHDQLTPGEMDGLWVKVDDDEAKTSATTTLTVPLNNVGTGIAQSLDGEFYLTESYIVPYQGCWKVAGIPVDCNWYKFRDSSHINLGQEMVYDVLPSTLYEFVQMDWDPALPDQVDIDNDILTTLANTDPDQQNIDADGDGLTDYYEIIYGLNAESADGDYDGLNDAQELTYATNPFSADSDSDGLNDYFEAVTGWLTTYTNNGVTSLTRVWSDPNSADADEDTLNDLEEFLFGFHPQVANDPNSVAELVQFENTAVTEDSGLILLNRFEETNGAQAFADNSGAGNTATCDPSSATCPVMEQSGRYAYAADFDGSNDSIRVDGIHLAQSSFTLATWAKHDSLTTDSQTMISQGKTSQNEGLELGRVAGMMVCNFYGSNFAMDFFDMDTNWHHWACTYDSQANRLTLYRDGAEVNAKTTSDDYSGSGSLVIGTLYDNSTHFNGLLDDVAVFDRALSASEVAAVMNGRFNANDLIVPPGVDLAYRTTMSNASSTTASGFLTAQHATVNPEIPWPAMALDFEPEHRFAYFSNDLAEENSIACVADGTCPTAGVSGVFSSAIEFDGADDYALLPALVVHDIENASIYDYIPSLSFWLYVESLPASGKKAMIIDTAITTTGALDVYLNNSGNLVFEYANNSAATTNTSFSFSSALNQWVHVSVNNGDVYINGARDFDLLMFPTTVVGPGRLGNSLDSSSPFHGRIDELVVYSDNVSAVDVMKGDYYKDDSLAAIYPLDELIAYDGTIFYDSQSNSNHATCAGSACPTLSSSTTGFQGRALTFDGVDDYLTQAGSYSTGSDGGASFSFYIQLTAYPSANAYIFDSTNSEALDIYITPSGQVAASIPVSKMTNPNTSIETHTSDEVIPLNTWTKVSLTYKLDWINGTAYYYSTISFNDAPDSTHNYHSGTSPSTWILDMTVGPGTIGALNDAVNGTSNFFAGSLDEMSLGVANLSFDPLSANFGYENLADGIRSVSCTDVFACPTAAAGKHGEAAEFDGDAYLTVNQGENFFSSNQFTEAAWVYPTDTDDNYHGIMGYQNGSDVNRSPGMWLDPQNKLHLGFGDGTRWNSYTTASALTANAWNHVAYTFDGTTLKVYINGTQVYTSTAWAGKSVYPATKYYIGRVDNFFQGRIDDAIILPVVVNADGINLLMNSAWPIIDIPTLYTTFSASAVTSLEASGSAQVSPYAVTSQHSFEQEVEAALQLQSTIDYPVVDDNAASLGVYLPLEETPGSSSFANLISYYPGAPQIDGSCYGSACPVAGVRGKVGRGVYFDGQDDFIKMDFNSLPSSNQPKLRTFAMWVKGKQGTLFEICPYGGTCRYGLQMDMNRVYTRENGLTTSLDLERNAWYHLALTIDSFGMARVYVNGAQVTSGTQESSSFNSNGLQELYLGSNGAGQDMYEGFMDDVRFYTSVLTQAQILSLYQNSAPVMHFEFDEDGDASDYTDNSVNAYTGQPSSTPCNAVTLTGLSVLGQANDARNLRITLDGNPLVYGSLDDIAASGVSGIRSMFCTSASLEVSIVKDDNTTVSLGSIGLSTALAGNLDTVILSDGSTSLSLDWAHDGNLTYQINPAPGTSGRISNGALFDGNGYITVTDSSVPLDMANDFSLHTWVKTSKNKVGLLVKSDDDGVWENGEKAWYIDADGFPSFVGAGNNYINADQAINDDYWHFVAVTWDRDASGSGGTGKMYVDGVDVTGYVSYQGNYSDVSGNQLKIGSNNYNEDDAPNIFSGRIDELAGYRRALSSAELYSIYLREARWYRDHTTSYLQVDSDAPAITLLSDATYWPNGYIQMAVATTDATSNVALLDVGLKALSANAFSWSGAVPCQDNGRSGAAWCPSFDTTTLGGEGTYEIQFRAVDAVGNETTSSVYTFNVDNTAPIANFSNSGQWANISNQDDEKLNWTTTLTGSLSDPDISTSPAVTGSGIASKSVLVELQDSTGYVIGEGKQQAALTDTTWSIDYEMEGARPQGTYTIFVTAEDQVGNTTTTNAGTLIFDERAPKVAFNHWEVNSEMIAGSQTLNGIVSDQADWSGETASFPFEEASGATEFYDYSPYNLTMACNGTDCPTITSGVFGQALDFDGIHDHIRVSGGNYATFAENTLSISAWVKPDTLPTSGTARLVTLAGEETAVLRSESQKLHFYMNFNGTFQHIRVSNVLTAGVWQHVAGTYDGQTMRLYYNGELVGSQAVAAPGTIYTATLPTRNMFFSSYDEPLDGQLDEVMVYERALSDAEIYALAQSTAAGVDIVEIGLEPFDFTESGASTTSWQNATINGGSWSYPLPTGIEGFYNIHLRAADTFGNQSEADVIWSGLLDTQAPVITGTTRERGSGSALYTEYTFTMSDFILDESSFIQPCAASSLTQQTYSDASLPHNGMVYQVSGTCRSAGQSTGTSLKACDGAGLCTTVNLTTLPGGPGDSVLITSPADGVTLADPGTLTIQGGASDFDGIQRIQVRVNGTLVDTITPDTSLPTDYPWTTSWTPTASGTYTLTVEMEDGLGRVLTDSIQVTVSLTPVTPVSPQVYFSSASYAAAENSGAATMTILLSAASTEPVTVNYATSDGTATEGADYTATSGTLTIAPGLTTATFDIPITQDSLVESDETVSISLSNPANALPGSPDEATLTIIDDDLLPQCLYLPVIIK